MISSEIINIEKELQDWLKEQKINLFEHQIKSFIVIENKKNLLLSSATGTGKTLSAFFPIINKLIKQKKNKEDTSFSVIYISPLRALMDDLCLNLEVIINFLKEKQININIFKRNADTTNYQRKKMLEDKPDIILTTPESFSLLTINKQEIIPNIKYVVIDELHSLLSNKRGINLFLNLTKLNNHQLIGLSATIKPLEKIANFLGPNTEIVVGSMERKRVFNCFTPETKFWIDYKKNQKEMYQNLLKEIKNYQCSVVFTNTRSLAESITVFLKENLPNELVLIHHGSLSKEVRYYAQEEMKKGNAKVVVSSTSLELGVDIGYVEHVFQISSPKSISRSLQRLGRAGHSFDKTISGTFLSSTVEETVENAVILTLASKNILDGIEISGQQLDVLCQFIISVGYLKKYIDKNKLFHMIKNVYFFKEFNLKDFKLVLQYLIENKKIILNDKQEIISNINYKRIFVQNLGFIVQQSLVPVFLEEKIIGYISAEFALELRKGESFVISGIRYVYKKSTITKVIVEIDEQKNSSIPRWYSEVLPLNFDLAKHIKKFQIDSINKLIKKENLIIDDYVSNLEAKESIIQHFKEQAIWLEVNKINILKEDDILIEIIKNRIVFHTLYGRKINNCLSKMVAINLIQKYKTTANIFFQDNGFIIDLDKSIKNLNVKDLFGLDEHNVLIELKKSLKNSQLFFATFIQNLYTCMFLHKGDKQQNNRLQLKFLMYKLMNEKTEHLIIKQTYREIFEDKFNINKSLSLYKKIKNKENKIISIEAKSMSPFAMYISIADVDSMYDKSNIIKELRGQMNHFFINKVFYEENKIYFFPLGIYFFYKKEIIMVVSDLHLNSKEELYYSDINILEELIISMNFYINLISPTSIILLGDIKENITFTSHIEKKYLNEFISFLKTKTEKIFLVKGNHDANLTLDIEKFDYLEYGKILLIHGHRKHDLSNYETIIIGHEHLVYNLTFKSGIKTKIKCFLISTTDNNKKIITLPSASFYKLGVDVNIENKKFLSPIMKNNNLSNNDVLIFFQDTWYKKTL